MLALLSPPETVSLAMSIWGVSDARAVSAAAGLDTCNAVAMEDETAASRAATRNLQYPANEPPQQEGSETLSVGVNFRRGEVGSESCYVDLGPASPAESSKS
jgi:hypothetical protein